MYGTGNKPCKRNWNKKSENDLRIPQRTLYGWTNVSKEKRSDIVITPK